MPWTAKQKRLFGADMGRAEQGKATRTGMSTGQLKKALREPTKLSQTKKK